MPVFQVDITWPSGKKMRTNVMPGHPLHWANADKPPKYADPRAIVTMEDACEYCMGSQFNRVNPVKVEWPSKVEPVKTLEESPELLNQAAAVVKALAEDPRTSEAK